MDEYKTEKAVYTPEDFLLWQENNLYSSIVLILCETI